MGVPKRADHGYRVHTAMTRLSWPLEDPEDKIDEIPSASRKRKAKKAFQFLMQYDNSEYASFVKRRRFFERHPDAEESKVKRPLRFIDELGVECALWPDLYHHLDLCETAERASDVRRQQRDNAPANDTSSSSAGSTEASQEDPAAPTWRLTGQDRTGQDRTGQDETGQDRTFRSGVCSFIRLNTGKLTRSGQSNQPTLTPCLWGRCQSYLHCCSSANVSGPGTPANN